MASTPPAPVMVANAPAPPPDPIEVPSTVQIALTSWVTKGLIAAGAGLATHGLATTGQVSNAAPVIAQVVVGVAIAAVSAWWANCQAKKHINWLDFLAKVVPNQYALSRSQQAAQKAAS